ncbi:MAG: hypothetical protein FWE84_03725 [Firmicutes bacterium]|nr:hypothetical protein [Bacillota bacterium]
MDSKKLFRKYYSRLAIGGVIKALVLGLIAGLAAGSVFVIVALFANNFATTSNYSEATATVILVSLGIFLAATVVTTPAFYFLFFRPKTKQIVERIDRLGLDERLITMVEFENDDSFVAAVQRKDAKAKLKQVSPKLLKLAAFMLVPTIVAFACAATYTSVTIGSVFGFQEPLQYVDVPDRPPIDEEPDVRRPNDGEFTYWVVEYGAYGGGYIDGDAFQVVIEGENATPIVARPYPGYAFVDWIVSGSKEPSIHDVNVYEDRFDVAHFEPVGEGDDDNEGDDESDEDTPDTECETGKDVKFDPNLIINGKLYYRDPDVLKDFLDQAFAILAAGGELSPELQVLLQLYFGGLPK